MKSIKRYFKVNREDISYLTFILESYSGLAVVRTIDSREAIIEILIAPQNGDLFEDLMLNLKHKEKLKLLPGTIDNTKANGNNSVGNREVNRSFHISTMGCQMNEYNSDYLSQTLIHFGYKPVQQPDQADLILINSCTVRAKAEQKAYSLLGRMIKLKRKRPHLKIGLMGCLAQQEGADLFTRFPELDLALGTREICDIQPILVKLESNLKPILANNLDLPPTSSFLECNGYFKGKLKAFITIMEGCNNFCSYCIVPFVRGRETSRAPEDILKEAVNLVDQGIKEITLLGQNVNSYFHQERQTGFPSLLKSLNKIKGLKRIRFTTSHPKDLSNDLIRCFGELDLLCPHIHLPFQAGSDRILKSMNRGYTRKDYLELISSLRDIRPNIAITSDVMVGFPGESQRDFEYTLDLIKKIEFDNLYSFKYSDRKGTAAAKLPQKIDEKEKTERLALLQQIQKSITLKKNRNLEGRQVVILIDGKSRKGGQWTGRTGTNKVANINSENNILGKLVHVKINRGFMNSLQGDFIGIHG